MTETTLRPRTEAARERLRQCHDGAQEALETHTGLILLLTEAHADFLEAVMLDAQDRAIGVPAGRPQPGETPGMKQGS